MFVMIILYINYYYHTEVQTAEWQQDTLEKTLARFQSFYENKTAVIYLQI